MEMLTSPPSKEPFTACDCGELAPSSVVAGRVGDQISRMLIVVRSYTAQAVNLLPPLSVQARTGRTDKPAQETVPSVTVTSPPVFSRHPGHELDREYVKQYRCDGRDVTQVIHFAARDVEPGSPAIRHRG
ncbi:hypothetical protein GCM10009541_35410 [Micromonospora gifhornensis]|uniref:Uncharacterized protein n=1 Tax=Micromonospora gifhornensis TaxID=84594 RepID=A0ABQ4IJL2_9ACTN|nr:hypothetical protein Vgi01_47810 [Micromonospora gifhornensis]